MRFFFRNVSPIGAVKDFKQVWSDNPYRWPVLALSMAATGGMMAVFIPKSEIVPPAPPEVTYITTFREGRTDEEIVASNVKNQKVQDVVQKMIDEQEEMKKDLYRQLGKATGVDTDKIERELAAEKKAADAAKAKAAKAAEAQAAGTQAAGPQAIAGQ